MTDCSDCRALEDYRQALTLCERALAASQSKVDTLRAQVARLQQMSGIVAGMTVREIADYCGVGEMAVHQWRHRFRDFPEILPGTFPHLYERGAVRDFLERHPKLAKNRK